MKLVFMGTPTFLFLLLRLWLRVTSNMRCLFSTTEAAGRGKKLRLSDVHKEALDLGLTVHNPTSFKSDKDRTIFRKLKADIAIVVAYGLILPNQILSAPKFGCLIYTPLFCHVGVALHQFKEQLWKGMMKPAFAS